MSANESHDILSSYREMIEKTPLFIGMTDADGTGVFLNSWGLEMTGYGDDSDIDITKKSISFFQPSIKQEMLDQAVKDGVWTGESILKHKDGHSIPVMQHIVAIKDELGNLNKFATIIRDISQEKEAEHKLEEAEALFAIAFEQCSAGIIVADAPDVKIRLVNNAALDISGSNERAVLDIKSPEYPKVCRTLYPDGTPFNHKDLPLTRAVLEGVVSKNIELILEAESGEKRWVLANAAPIKDKAGDIIAGVVVFTDITEPKNTELALRESEKKYKGLFESSRDAIILMDENLKLLDCNQATLEIFAFDNKDLFLSKSFKELSPERQPDDSLSSEMLQTILKNTVEKGACDYIWKHKKNDNELFDATVLISKMEIDGRDCFQISIRDMTEKNRLELEVRQTQKMDSIGQLAGGVAHDFNNMLTGIIGAAEMLQLKSPGDINVSKYVKRILETADKASDLTQKLLTFSRRKQGIKKNFDLHNVLRDVVAILERSIDRRIVIECDFAAPFSIIDGDNTDIQSAVLNLLINARDSMPAGGTITIKTRETHKIIEHKSIFRENPFVELQITDTGKGMSKEIQEHIFEPFFTTKDRGKGTGLGLSAVYGIINDHKGFIDVQSQEGKGTSVTVTLPLSSNRRTEEPERDMTEIKYGEGTILVVDDEKSIVEGAECLLAELGYDVLSARDGNEAIEVYKERKDDISLVLLDLVMPNKNGEDTFYELKEINPEIKVLLSSGYAFNLNIRGLIHGGAKDFIQKPYRLVELSHKIFQIIQKG